MSWEAAKNNKFVKPYRFYNPRTDCSFLFLPLLREDTPVRQTALTNLTLANKYDVKSSKAIGVSFIGEDGDYQNVQWCFIDSPWVKDDEIENKLAENYPFRKAKKQRMGRYNFEYN